MRFLLLLTVLVACSSPEPCEGDPLVGTWLGSYAWKISADCTWIGDADTQHNEGTWTRNGDVVVFVDADMHEATIKPIVDRKFMALAEVKGELIARTTTAPRAPRPPRSTTGPQADLGWPARPGLAAARVSAAAEVARPSSGAIASRSTMAAAESAVSRLIAGRAGRRAIPTRPPCPVPGRSSIRSSSHTPSTCTRSTHRTGPRSETT